MSHAGAASSPRSRRPADHQDDNATTDDEHAAVPRLPLAKHDDSSLRRPIAILFFLQSLSLVPAMVGFGVCWSHALAKGTMEGYSTRADWMVASLWSIMTGYSSYSLAAGLIRRWLVFYDLVPACVRLLGLQAFVWPLTHFTVAKFFPDHPVAAWIVCALTASACHTISLWVTSNIRLHRAIAQRQGARSRLIAPWAASVPYLRQSASRASTRTLDWGKVVRRTVIPLSVLAYVTLAAMLYQQYDGRPSYAQGIFGGRLQPLYSPPPAIVTLLCPPYMTAAEAVTPVVAGPHSLPGRTSLSVEARRGQVALGKGPATRRLEVELDDADTPMLNALLASGIAYLAPPGGTADDVVTVQLVHPHAYGQCHLDVRP